MSAIKTAKSVKLIYFGGRGRAEKTRLVFAASGLPYTDTSVAFPDWPGLKPKTPYGSLPVLDLDGKQIGQSSAIFRFVAAEAGLIGSNNVENAILNGIVDAADDVEGAVIPLLFAKDQAFEDGKKKILETLNQFMNAMEKLLKDSKSGYFSEKLTLADIAVFNVIDSAENITGESNLCKSQTRLKELLKKVSTHKGIKEYLAKRPADGLKS